METSTETGAERQAGYKVGVRNIDDDHSVLIRLASALEDYQARGAAWEVAAAALARLSAYAGSTLRRTALAGP